jgi:hypothetical protein
MQTLRDDQAGCGSLGRGRKGSECFPGEIPSLAQETGIYADRIPTPGVCKDRFRTNLSVMIVDSSNGSLVFFSLVTGLVRTTTGNTRGDQFQ